MKVKPKLEEHTMQQHMFPEQPDEGAWQRVHFGTGNTALNQAPRR
jgi:hypothetical protein